MSNLVKKLIIIFGVLVLFLFIAFIGAAWYLGAFNSVDITWAERGPYHFVFLEHRGMYQKIADKIEQVHEYLEARRINTLHPAAQYLDDPKTHMPAELRSRGGWIVADSVTVDTPYIFTTIEKRSTALARIRAHPAIAPFKTYPALDNFLMHGNRTQDTTGTVLEIYYDSGVVEVEMPILPENQN